MAPTSPSLELLGPDLGPEDDARAWRAWAREFARDVVRPVGDALDRMDAAEVPAPGSPLTALLEQAHREGFTRLGAPPRFGGFDLRLEDECLVVEELAMADAAIAGLLLASPRPFAWAATCGSAALADEFAAPYFSGARTDWIGCSAPPRPIEGIQARRDGDGWSLSGETGALIGGGIATHALVPCLIGDGPGRGTALVALGASGVTRRPVAGGAGLRALCRAQLVLRGVRLEAGQVIVADGLEWARAAHAQAVSGMLTLGIGRAAYEGAVRWAREALWAGGPGHAGEQVRPELYRMFTLLESARALARAAFLSADHARAAHAFAAEAAADVTAAVARLCGGDATPSGVPFLDGSTFSPDKLLRDARAAHQ